MIAAPAADAAMHIAHSFAGWPVAKENLHSAQKFLILLCKGS